MCFTGIIATDVLLLIEHFAVFMDEEQLWNNQTDNSVITTVGLFFFQIVASKIFLNSIHSSLFRIIVITL